MTTEEAPPLPLHVEETVATIAALHAAHYREARALQKAVSRATRGIAQPAMLIVSTFAIIGWITLNLALPQLGRAALDLCLAAMILISQRHDDEMATRREQMTLELAPRRSGRSPGKASRCAGRARRDTGGGKGRGQRLDRQNTRPVAEPNRVKAQACWKMGLGCTLPEEKQENGLSVGRRPQGASRWRDYPHPNARARSFAP